MCEARVAGDAIGFRTLYNNVPHSGAAKYHICAHVPTPRCGMIVEGCYATYGIAGYARLAHRLFFLRRDAASQCPCRVSCDLWHPYMRYAHAMGSVHSVHRWESDACDVVDTLRPQMEEVTHSDRGDTLCPQMG